MHTITKFISPLSLAIDRSIISTEIIDHTFQGSFTEMIAEIKMIADSWDCAVIYGDDEITYDVWGTLDGDSGESNDFRLSVSCLLHN